MNIYGYKRENGSYGIRNHVLVLPASVCATHVAERIAASVTGAVSAHNQHGCCQVGDDYALTFRTMAGFGQNPNVGAVLVVGLGCEGQQADTLAAEIAKSGKPVEYIVIQELGGTLKSISEGSAIAARMARELSLQKRVEFDIGELVLGLECGGSDPTSGLASNPTIGYVSNKLVELGGSSVLSETTEVIGAEHLLAERFADPVQRERFLAMVSATENRAIELGIDLRKGQPTPGNIEGGITTIEEKSLGCMHKAGSAPFEGAIDYSEPIPPGKRGLFYMDTPGQDMESVTGLAAGGAHVIVFSTGRGTPTGCPVTPVIKITGNSATYEKMRDDIDINVAGIVEGTSTLPEMGEELFTMLVDVCNGMQTKAEVLGHHEFGIYRLTGAF